MTSPPNRTQTCEPPPSRRRPARLVLAGLLLAIVLGAVLLPRRDELDDYKARLASRGEKLKLIDVAPAYSASIAARQNEFDSAAARLTLGPLHPGFLEPMHGITNGRARVTWREPQVPIGNARGASWQKFETQMDREEPTLAVIRRLVEPPLDGSAHDPAAFPTAARLSPNLVRYRMAAQDMLGAVMADLHRQRLDAALTNLHSLFSLACLHDDGGGLVERMIQVAILRLTLGAVWDALQAPGWDDTRLARLHGDLRRIDFMRGMPHTAEMERAMAVVIYDMAPTNQAARAWVSLGTPTNVIARTLNDAFFFPVWQQLWSRTDELRLLQVLEPTIETLRAATTNCSYQIVRKALDEALDQAQRRHSRWDGLRYQLGTSVLPNWSRAILISMRTETLRQMAMGAVALRRWRERHGDLPANLDSLVPEYLPTVPRDWMNGAPLLYHRLSRDRFELRSVGDNGVDEEGAGDDLVWPEPEEPGPQV